MDHATQTLLVEALLGSALVLWAITFLSSMLQHDRHHRPHPPHQGE